MSAGAPGQNFKSDERVPGQSPSHHHMILIAKSCLLLLHLSDSIKNEFENAINVHIPRAAQKST